MRPLARLLAAAALLSACSRDLDVPPETTAPKIAGFSPSSAYAGERLVLTGTGLDPDPQGNLVQFARASARAEASDGGSITVRVPASAGTGPLTVTTKGGVSDPTSSFGYRGLGELRARAASAELPMLHKPYRLHSVGGETFLHSDLLLGVLRYGDPAFIAASAVSMDTAWWSADATGPSVVWLEGTDTGSRLVRTPAPSGAPLTADIDDDAFGTIVALRGNGATIPPAVAVLRVDSEPMYVTTTTAALHRLSDLGALPGYETPVLVTATDFERLRGCVDAGAGQLACLVRETLVPQTPYTIARISFDPSVAVSVLPPPGVALSVVGTPPDLPMCADPASRQVVVPAEDGTLAVYDLSVPALVGFVETGSRTPARSVTCLGGGRVLVSKREDDLVTLVDLATGGILWSAHVPLASHADVDPSGPTSVVHAVGEGDNRVRVLSLDTGALLALRTFDVLPGRVHAPDALLDRTAMQGAAWYVPSGMPPHLALVASTNRGLVTWPLSAQRGDGLFPQFTDFGDAIGVVPSTDPDYVLVAREQQFLGATMNGVVQLALDAPDYAHFATSAGLETIDWYGGTTTHGVSAMTDAEFTSLGYLPDGRIFASVRDGSQWSVRAWTEAQAIAGSAPGSAWTSPSAGSYMIAAAAVLDGQLRAFYWDASDQLRTVALSGTLGAVPGTTATLSDRFYSILAVSPNGRTFVSWDFQPYSRDTAVVVWSSDAAAGFPRLATIPVAGQVSGVAFDDTGEALYVVTRGPDRIVVIE